MIGRKRILLIGAVAAALAVGMAALLVNIFERKQEAARPFFAVVQLTEETEDPAIWGRNFPLQYDGYRRTVDQQRTRYGGSEAIPRTPSQVDPRSVVAQSRLEEDPRLKTMWAGYAFAVDFREERGHAYMLDDQTFTERQQVTKQPGTCINCHASNVRRVSPRRRRRPDRGLREGERPALRRGPQAGEASGGLHRLPRPHQHGPAGHPAGVHGGHGGAEGRPGRPQLRREPGRQPPGDARLRLWPVPRRVLLQGPAEAAGLPLEQRPAGRGHARLLRRGRAQGLRAQADRRPGAEGPAPGVRAVEPGHPRPQRRGLRRLPHALHPGGGA